ncbi:LuxR C-terminal-related transcriptional regulator [Blastococcus sp. VKM Ac-2987]|uniref:LuxR C-terminal-related transcriptional regulator n=1 Tax=Blastococcus sp. VKM Ac-2987 TaxID=3004141 RepID=UPI003FA4D014
MLGLIAEGRPNTAIASALVVTPGAVEKHTQHIFVKLGLAPGEDRHRRVLATPACLRSRLSPGPARVPCSRPSGPGP